MSTRLLMNSRQPERSMLSSIQGSRGVVGLSMGAAFSALVSSSALASTPGAYRPNILFLFADDLGYGDVGCYRSENEATPVVDVAGTPLPSIQPLPRVYTPVLDELAAQGTRFTQFYVTSGFCTPSRSSALTGQFPSRWKLYAHLAHLPANAARGMPNWLDPDAPSLPRLMQRAGYRTALFGKWHLGGGSAREFGGLPVNSPQAPEVTSYGFDEARTFFGNSPTWLQSRPVDRPHDVYPYLDDGLATWAAKMVTDSAIDFLDRHTVENPGQPFMMYVWFHEPHVPLFPTSEMRKPFLHVEEPAQTHYAAIYFMDREIGRLLDRLEELGLADDTLVLFSSDNGGHLINGASNDPLRGTKGSTWEGGMRVPLIVRWPRVIPSGRVDDSSVVNIVDFFPTFAALAGMPVPANVQPDGVDMIDSLAGREFNRPVPMFWHSLPHSWHPEWAVREGKWKLLMDTDGGRLHLYDLEDDPGETRNLADQFPDRVHHLRHLLEEWRSELPDTWKIAKGWHGPIPSEPAGPNPFGVHVLPRPEHTASIHGPVIVREGPVNESSMLVRGNGTLELYFITKPESESISVIRSTDHGLSWSDPEAVLDLPGKAYYAVQALEDRDGALHLVFHISGRGAGGYRGRLYHVYHTRQSGDGSWSPPQRVIPGYVGAIRGFMQHSSGRLVLSVGRAVPERETAPDRGPDYGWNDVVTFYSENDGATWEQSPDILNFPLDVEFITRYGAIEPDMVELSDGRIWMLIRDRGGWFMESFSKDGGVRWTRPEKTRLITSDSPATFLKLRDGRIILFFNSCQNWGDPRSYARGGREVLHAAISSDDGRTWSGFREVLQETVGAYRGDRGTSYASAAETGEGKVALFAGQGDEKRYILLFDPAWLEETALNDPLEHGPASWSQYGARGIAVETSVAGRFRFPVASLKPVSRDIERTLFLPVLPDRASGATWNFPALHEGRISLIVSFDGPVEELKLYLTDHFNRMDDSAAGDHAVYRFDIPIPDEMCITGVVSVEITWNDAEALLRLNGSEPVVVPAARSTGTGLNYLRVEATAVDGTGAVRIRELASGPMEKK